MGGIAKVGDADDLARVLLEVLEQSPWRDQGADALIGSCRPQATAQAYLDLYQRILAEKG